MSRAACFPLKLKSPFTGFHHRDDSNEINFIEWVDPDAVSTKPKAFSYDINEFTIGFMDYSYTAIVHQPPRKSVSLPFCAPLPAKDFKKTTQVQEKKKSRKKRKGSKRTNFDKGFRSKSETGYLGVRFSTTGDRFRATVNLNKKAYNVGTFDTAKEAAEEYDQALIRITRGNVERSRLNFPKKWNMLYEEVLRLSVKTDSESNESHFSTQNGQLEPHPCKRRRLKY